MKEDWPAFLQKACEVWGHKTKVVGIQASVYVKRAGEERWTRIFRDGHGARCDRCGSWQSYTFDADIVIQPDDALVVGSFEEKP